MGALVTVGRVLRLAARWIALKAGSSDPRRLKRRMTPVEGWDERVDGRARRLTDSETITVTRVGRFADTEPLRTAEGWRDPFRSAVVGVWASAVGLAALVGWFRGKGPLGGLSDLRNHDEAAGD